MAQREKADLDMRQMNETLRRLHKMPPKPHKPKSEPKKVSPASKGRVHKAKGRD